MQQEIKNFLRSKGVDFIYFVDISMLSEKQSQGYSTAILFGYALTKDFVQKVANHPNYVKELKRLKKFDDDEFSNAELKTDGIADFLSSFINDMGFKAFSQSEKSIMDSGLYNNETRTSPLPHKTIAGMAGLGWIGKNNLLITQKFGCAISMCTVLTDAPLKTINSEILNPQCKDCLVCVDICPEDVLSGNTWTIDTRRDEIVDVYHCTTCLKCMVHCPETQIYSLSL